MWTCGVSAERAFDVLTWRSQHTNTKLRRIAAQFLADLTAGSPPEPKARDTVDRLLLTAHIPSDQPHDQRSPQNDEDDGPHLPDAPQKRTMKTENEPPADADASG